MRNLFAAARRPLWALALLAAFFTACSPPSSSSSSPASTVDEIIAAHLAARGGRDRIQALRSIRETGTVTASDGRVARVVREIQRPGLFRLEFSYQGTTSVFAHDGKAGWQIAPLQGQFEPRAMPPEADPAGGADQRDIEGPLVDWREKGHVVELAGRESIAGAAADKLKVTLRGGVVRYDYVDVASHMVVRSDVSRVVRGHRTELQSTFSDFRKVSGIVFPHRLEIHFKDRPQVLEIVVERIELNPELDPASFRMPS
jgi:outer membrane lipoprotein-sorting protein